MKTDRLKFFVVGVLIGTLAGSTHAQKKSEREELGYLGPVRTVRTVTVEYSIVGGRPKAKKPKIEIERFNRRGVRLENSEYDENGKCTWRDTPIFSKGKVVGWRETSEPEDPDEFFYKFDDAGNMIEQNTYDDTGKLRNQWVYIYDSHNRLIRETHESGKSSFKVKTFSYDEKGREKEISTFVKDEKGLTPVNEIDYHRKMLMYTSGEYWTSQQMFSANGDLVKKIFVSRDQRGNVIEDVTYDRNGNVMYRLRYQNKYDKRGNLIHSKTFRLQTIDRKSSYQLEEIDYITIKYFGK